MRIKWSGIKQGAREETNKIVNGIACDAVH
jgi:hypothetical protein